MNPELFKVFCEEFTAEVNRLHADEGAHVEQVKAELARVARRIAKLVDAIAEGVPARAVKDELVRLEARQEELQSALANVPALRPALFHPNMAELYRTKVAALHEALNVPDTQAEAMELIRSRVEAIVLTPEDGTLRVGLQGELVAISACARTARSPAPFPGPGFLSK